MREAIQNCWDATASDPNSGSASRSDDGVLDGRRTCRVIREEILVDPPPGLPLGAELGGPACRSCTSPTSERRASVARRGPTSPGLERDFVDFVRNIGQPPDKDLGGGSFGYGKAAFYLASRARTILVDTLCTSPGGDLERRFIGCALGDNFDEDGSPSHGSSLVGRSRRRNPGTARRTRRRVRGEGPRPARTRRARWARNDGRDRGSGGASRDGRRQPTRRWSSSPRRWRGTSGPG